MAFEHKEGSGSLFKNTYRTDDNNKPHWTGSGKTLDGKAIQLSAYENTGANGVYLSVKFKLAEEVKAQPAPVKKQAPKDDDFEDSDLAF